MFPSASPHKEMFTMSVWFKFLTDVPVISTKLLTTYMLPGLHSVLKDVETLERDQVVGMFAL